MDATADLESARIRPERFAGRTFVAQTEHDEVAAFELVALVKLGIPACGLLRDKIRAQRGRIATECASNDLLHLAFVKIDAWSEHVQNLTRRATRVEERK